MDQIEASESEASPSRFSISASMSSSSESLLEVGTGSSSLTVISHGSGVSLDCGLGFEVDLSFGRGGSLDLFSLGETLDLVVDCEDEGWGFFGGYCEGGDGFEAGDGLNLFSKGYFVKR